MKKDLVALRTTFVELRNVATVFRPVLLGVAPSFKRMTSDSLMEAAGPETAVNDFLHSLKASFTKVDASIVGVAVRRAVGILARPAVRRWLARQFLASASKARTKLLADQRAAPYVGYLDELERELPGISIVMLAKSELFSKQGLVDVLRLPFLDGRFRSATGEERARALKEAAAHVTEHVHSRWAASLAVAERLRRGLVLVDHESYGTRLRTASHGAPLSMRSMLNPDWAHIRNAASHAGRWQNSPDFSQVTLTDTNRGPEPWKRTYGVEELYDQLDELAEEMVALFEAVQLKVMEAFNELVMRTAILDELAHAAGGADKPAHDVRTQVQAYFAPLGARLAAATRDNR